MRFRRSFVFAAAAAAFGANILMGAPAANASGTQDSCPTNRVCLWFNSNSGGARADLRVSDASLANELFNDGPPNASGWLVQVENNAASFQNRSGFRVVFYDLRNCTTGGSGERDVAAGAKDNFGAALKNRVSSLLIGSDGATCMNVDQSGA